MPSRIKKYLSHAMFVLAALGFSGCKNFMTTSAISEGEIEYGITVIDNRNILMTTDMMPTNMTLSFKDNKTCFNLSAFGLFSTDLITNIADTTIIQTLTLMGKKYAVFANKDSIKDYLKNEPTATIVEDDKTKKIAGYKCKHALVTYNNPDFPAFDVYYTEDIKIDNPNFYSQYAPIKGVLMEFNVFRYNVFMKLTAKQVNKKDVEDSKFTAVDNHKVVSKKEMDSYFIPTN